MECHVRQPDVVLLVHGQHVRQVEEVGAPPVDDVAGAVEREHRVDRDGLAPVAVVLVAPKRNEFGTSTGIG